MILKHPDTRIDKVRVDSAVFKRTKQGWFEVPNVSVIVNQLFESGFVQYEPRPEDFPSNRALNAQQKPRSSQLHATIIRCGCEGRIDHAGQPCPKGIVEDLGMIASYHRNLFINLLWWIQRFIQERKRQWQLS